jgi:superfamily II DNA or RNA helicase
MDQKNLKSLDRVLTAYGYAIKKSSLTPRRVQHLRKELTVSPTVAFKFAKQTTQPFAVYTESPTRFYLPRQWANEVYGQAEAVSIPEGTALKKELTFIGKPYDYQKEIVDKFLNAGANGLICVPCGRGKTFMAIWTAMRLGKKFLIVVDKEFLMQQWKGELEALVPGISVGIIQEDKCQVEEEVVQSKALALPELKDKLRSLGKKVGGKRDELVARIREEEPSFQEFTTTTKSFDCSIAMIQTIVGREFPEGTFDPFGFTIFDECHHLGASNFSRALLKVQTNCMLGLSATPKRDDGLTKVFEWFLGKPVHWEKTRDPDPQVIVRCEQITSDDSTYTTVPTDYRGEMVMGRLLTNVIEYAPRTKKIADIIVELLDDAHRRVLVLSERITHLEALETLLKPTGLTMSYYIGGMKEEVREQGAQTARVLLASYAMASEAMNIKTLNTVILASPRKKVEQSTGRILRIKPEQRLVHPVIVDIVDCHTVYQSQWRKRAMYYKKCAYKIQHGSHAAFLKVDDEKQEQLEESTKEPSGCLLIDDDDD